jgi:hypothetical protein
VSKDAIIAIGVCAEKVESVKPLCGNILLALVKSGRGKFATHARYDDMTEIDAYLWRTDSITAQAVVILRSLVKSTESHSAASRLVAKLCQVLPLIRGGDARASIYWLGTQHAAVQHQNSSAKAFPDVAVWAPDLLRNGVKGFVTEVNLADRRGQNSSNALTPFRVSIVSFGQDRNLEFGSQLDGPESRI